MNVNARIDSNDDLTLRGPTMRRLGLLGRNKFRRIHDMSPSDISQLNALAKYPHTVDDFARNGHGGLFNINAELFNPHFVAEFWQRCKSLGENLSAAYWRSLQLELISFEMLKPGSTSFRLQHFASTWKMREHGKTLRIAGGLFTSDLSILLQTRLSESLKLRLVEDSTRPLLRSRSINGFDVLTIGFPVSARIMAVLGNRPTVPITASGKTWRVQRIYEPIENTSLTAKGLLRSSNSAFPFLLRASFGRTSKLFVVFALLDCEVKEDVLRRHRFWLGSVVPLLADWFTLCSVKGLPGQASRLIERRDIARRAASAAFNL